jgi:2-keto-4-pentenoate hydratase
MSVGERQDGHLVDESVALLEAAARDRVPVEPLTDRYAGLTVEEAYRIQRRNVSRRLEGGDRVIGYKVGLTSRAMQELLGVDDPDYAPILSSMLLRSGDQMSRGALIQPKVEAEIAFILRDRLRGPGVTREDVVRATDGVAPAIEVIDSRIRDWRITLADTIADMASSARIVIGGAVPLGDTELRSVSVVLERNGEEVATGLGSAVLDDPVLAVAWAANTLGALGETMDPGHVVMPGAMHAAVPVDSGDTFTARFDRLGSVTVRFT